MVNRYIPPLFLACLLALILCSGCRSEADKMAEFCLNFDAEVKASSDCRDMANRLDRLLAPPQPQLKNRNICSDTTACLPCKSAAREMLKQCGYDSDMKPILAKMHFSNTLRKQLEQVPNEE